MSDELDMRSIRESLKWTQLQMAEYLGLDRSSISRLEIGGGTPRGPVRRLLQSLKDQVAAGGIAVGEPVSAEHQSSAPSPAADEASLASAAGAPHSVQSHLGKETA